jgi:membrane dipeptidase
MNTLTHEQEKKARKIHDRAIIIDSLNASILDEEYLEKMQRGGITATNYTIALNQNLSETVKKIAEIYCIIEASKVAVLIESTADIREAKDTGKTGIIMGFQSVGPLEGNLDLLDIYHKLGVRIIQLTYHFKTVCGDGCKEPGNSGLSLFGRELIKKMNDLGMIVDLAHVGERTELDAIAFSSHPVIASHSNIHSLVPEPQNKKDEMIKALAKKGGIIGITGFPRLVEPNPTLDHLLNYIDYVVQLVGIDHVGIGVDFAEGWTDSPSHRKMLIKIDGRIYDWPMGIDTITDFPNFTRGLIARGYSEEDIKKVLGGNYMRVLEEVIG